MKKFIPYLMILLGSPVLAQPTSKYITSNNVDRVIRALASDEMKGRPANKPEDMAKATAFIESEFTKIGLKPLPGLKGFRQEFEKKMIAPEQLSVTIDGEKIDAEKAFVITNDAAISITSGLTVRSVPFDEAISNKDQYFRRQIGSVLNDMKTSWLVMIAPEFEANFKRYKAFLEERFDRQQNTQVVMVLGKIGASTYDIKGTQKITTIKMTNVVGQLPGKTKADEMIVFSGHYDHLGISQPVDGDSISNGADDDASGTTAVIELARYYKKTRENNRTLVFAAFTAEEIGGFGSKYFSEQLDPEKVVAMFNIEMIGKPSKWGQNSAFITGYERSDFGQMLQKNLAGTPFKFEPDPYPQQNLFYRSDNATLARLGVPAHTISTDQIDIDKFYHTVNDEVETLDIGNIVLTIRAIALSAKTLVSGEDTPTRIDKSTVN